MGDLPVPSPEAAAHSARLSARLRDEIVAAGGWLGFARFMELALYAPGLGYYSAGARKFGAAGDFITAPEISPLFGRCIAAQCAEVLRSLGGGDILELGAGSGVLAADVLSALSESGDLPQHYYILDVSADLRERQRATLAERAPQWLPQVQWLNRLPSAFTGIVLGNEVLDALPVTCFQRDAQDFEERGVALNARGEFVWQSAAASMDLATALAALERDLGARFAPSYISEICLRLPAFIASLAESLARGALLFLDYGYPRRAYYHPDRSMGTLLCHYRQRAHPDPFRFIGLQDITAHVDFTAVAEAGVAAGLELAGYTTQSHFLLAMGIGELAKDWRAAQEVKRLTLPEEMGERFKAVGFLKGLDTPLQGFRLRDLSVSL